MHTLLMLIMHLYAFYLCCPFIYFAFQKLVLHQAAKGQQCSLVVWKGILWLDVCLFPAPLPKT